MGAQDDRTGDGPEAARPPLLLVHGLASSFDHGWRKPGWVDLATDAGRAVPPLDLPGHGGTPPPAGPDDLAGALAAAVAPHRQVDAVGFSLGARLLLELAAREPHRFRKLVVIGVGANLFREDEELRHLVDVFEQDRAEPDDVVATLFLRLAHTAGNDPRALAAVLRHPHEPLDRSTLGRITCPVLVVMGDRDFAGPPDPLVEALPDAELVVLPGVDHFGAPNDFGAMSRALAFVDADPFG
ncbi:MAG: alpha/beta fold hydrolase [Acidimicrobiia bacterium]|nr:alpha/beta fold hydrolase [Acidimicrobiia bacterium]